MVKSVLVVLLFSSLTTSVLASEASTESRASASVLANAETAAEGMNSDCCWDKVDFDRPLEAGYETPKGPDCCWVPVWGEIPE